MSGAIFKPETLRIRWSATHSIPTFGQPCLRNKIQQDSIGQVLSQSTSYDSHLFW
jgi:hypothetical protein